MSNVSFELDNSSVLSYLCAPYTEHNGVAWSEGSSTAQVEPMVNLGGSPSSEQPPPLFLSAHAQDKLRNRLAFLQLSQRRSVRLVAAFVREHLESDSNTVLSIALRRAF